MPTVLHTAEVLCSMTRPPQPGGGVLVDGERIVAVGEADRLRPDAARHVHHDGVLLPGLVDARTAVEQADGRAGAVGASRWDAQRWGRSARRGAHALLRAGVAASGDVVRHGSGVPACARAGLVGDSWLGIAGVDRTEHDAVVAAAGRSLGLPAAGRRIGLAPDPIDLGTGVLQALSTLARTRDVPVHVAVGRSFAERDALTRAEGPLAERARAGGLAFEWLEAPTRLAPLAYLDALGLLGGQTSVAYARDVTASEATLLARRRVTVVVCDADDDADAGSDAGVPLERFAEAGVRLALGSDGGPDVLATARGWVHRARRCGLARWPGAAGPLPLEEAALRLVTVDGAAAMGWGEQAGVLAAGRRADFVVMDLDTTPEAVYRDLVHEGAGRQVSTVLGGVRRARRDSADAPWPPVDVHEDERRRAGAADGGRGGGRAGE